MLSGNKMNNNCSVMLSYLFVNNVFQCSHKQSLIISFSVKCFFTDCNNVSLPFHNNELKQFCLYENITRQLELKQSFLECPPVLVV